MQISTATAFTDIRDYFILDKWHDLWKVESTNYWYYKANIPYSNFDLVKERMEKNYNYVSDFYSQHNFEYDYINWNNNDSYFYINWNTPAIFNNINDIRNITGWLYYSYRKNWNIEWIKWSEMMSNFITWYNSEDNKIIILYPIKNKLTWFTEWFVQYPCWNLVCKDKTCSSLKTIKKNYTCSIKAEKNNFYNNENLDVKLDSNQNDIIFKSIYVNWIETVKNIDHNKYTINNLNVWNYKITLTAINPHNNEVINCESDNVTVNKAPICGDWMVDKWETCDDWNILKWDWCYKCDYENPSCSFTSKYACIDNWTSLSKVLSIKESNWVLSSIFVGNKSVEKNYLLTYPGINNVSLQYVNYFNPSISYSCTENIKVRSNPFCWDWIVNNNEICDPNDSLTWPMCTNTCETIKPVKCNINIGWDLVTWRKIFIWIDKDYYTKIDEVNINWKLLDLKDSDYSTFTFNKKWSYKVNVKIVNKLDSKNYLSCSSDIEINDTDPCR
jgi:hypothetical protein